MKKHRLTDAIKTLLKFFHTTYEKLIITSYRKEFVSEIFSLGQDPHIVQGNPMASRGYLQFPKDAQDTQT
jgi:hypothetical protein